MNDAYEGTEPEVIMLRALRPLTLEERVETLALVSKIVIENLLVLPPLPTCTRKVLTMSENPNETPPAKPLLRERDELDEEEFADAQVWESRQRNVESTEGIEFTRSQEKEAVLTGTPPRTAEFHRWQAERQRIQDQYNALNEPKETDVSNPASEETVCPFCESTLEECDLCDGQGMVTPMPDQATGETYPSRSCLGCWGHGRRCGIKVLNGEPGRLPGCDEWRIWGSHTPDGPLDQNDDSTSEDLGEGDETAGTGAYVEEVSDPLVDMEDEVSPELEAAYERIAELERWVKELEVLVQAKVNDPKWAALVSPISTTGFRATPEPTGHVVYAYQDDEVDDDEADLEESEEDEPTEDDLREAKLERDRASDMEVRALEEAELWVSRGHRWWRDGTCKTEKDAVKEVLTQIKRNISTYVATHAPDVEAQYELTMLLVEELWDDFEMVDDPDDAGS